MTNTHFSNDHPFAEFENDFYLESDHPNEHIYIFKFPKRSYEKERKIFRGAEVVLNYSKDKSSITVYPLIFQDEYNWDVDTRFHAWCTSTYRRSMRDILEQARKELQYQKYGKQRKDC